jgi:hypothetical protein
MFDILRLARVLIVYLTIIGAARAKVGAASPRTLTETPTA